MCLISHLSVCDRLLVRLLSFCSEPLVSKYKLNRQYEDSGVEVLLGLSDDHIQVLFGNFRCPEGFVARMKNLGKNRRLQVSFRHTPRHAVGLVQN